MPLEKERITFFMGRPLRVYYYTPDTKGPVFLEVKGGGQLEVGMFKIADMKVSPDAFMKDLAEKAPKGYLLYQVYIGTEEMGVAASPKQCRPAA